MTEIRTDDLQLLLSTLPAPIRAALDVHEDALLEVVLDLGRPPQARFPGRAVDLRPEPVTAEEIGRVVTSVGEFGADNRAGIEGTLHRISCIRNRKGHIIGLTLRVGRAVFGTIDQIRDQIEAGKSVLLLGPPGVGKTTRLREIARVLADEFSKRVVVIDTSNEIAGDGDVPHPAIGGARRMQVAHPDAQHGVMIEAVENHMPEVIVVDEIGTAQETAAARTIAERGVQLIGTAHGNTLENLVLNPSLADLIGGVQTVTLSDEEARFRGTQKTISERKGPPTFDAVVELISRDLLIVHPDAGLAVDKILRGVPAGGLHRRISDEVPAAPEPLETAAPAQPTREEEPGRLVTIYAYAISRDSIERVIRDLRLNARTINRPERADLVIALRARSEDQRLQRILDMGRAKLLVVKKNTTAQIRRLLQDAFNTLPGMDDEEAGEAVREVEAAVRRVLDEGVPAELSPRPASQRRLQHRIVTRHQLTAHSQGSEPQRRLVIYPS